MFGDAICAHCREPWEVHYLRHHADQDETGTTPPRGHYRAVLSGAGCPACGYDHAGPGAYDIDRLEALVMDGVTDDDPALFF
jgi:hypothetical protein